MWILIWLALFALLLSLCLTPICKKIFFFFNIIDRPDQGRKLHKTPIPPAGGPPIVASYFGAIGLAMLLLPQGTRLAVHHNDLFWRLLPAAALVFLIGLIDDIVGLNAKSKLMAQCLAAAWACFAGVRIHAINNHPAAPWWAVPLSVIWLIGCMNAVNLIDGLDGLASGVALFASLTTFIAAVVQDNIGLALATAPLVGCLLGFLRYNFAPASVFLGDSGSLTIGFLLGCFSIIWCEKSATILGMAAPLIALGLPLMDVSLSIGRRFLRHRPIFVADRGHIHHRLLAQGFRPRDAALILYAVCGAAAMLSLLQSLLAKQVGGLAVILFCGFAWFGGRALGYVEFHVARQMVMGGGFRRVLKEEICLSHLRQALAQARSLEECWPAIRDACRDLGFHFARLESPLEIFEESFAIALPIRAWEFQISLTDYCSLKLRRNSSTHECLALISLIDILRRGLPARETLPGQARTLGAHASIKILDIAV